MASLGSHLHAPGTILNNQYCGEDAWEQFLAKLEGSTPRIRAIGITDYYSVDTYVAVRKHKQAGRLSDVDLVFANVEMRYRIGTARVRRSTSICWFLLKIQITWTRSGVSYARTHLRGLW